MSMWVLGLITIGIVWLVSRSPVKAGPQYPGSTLRNS